MARMRLKRNMKDPESREFWLRLDSRIDHYLELPEWLREAVQKPHKDTKVEDAKRR